MKYEYSYPVEELNELIEKLNKGIIPTVPEDMLDEARLLYQEIQSELFDGDDIMTEEEIKAQQERIKKKVEENKHKAHKEDIKIKKLSDKQMEKLKEAVETSIVRPYPSDYNLSDEEKYGSEERAALYEKFSKLKRIYRDPNEFRYAFNICQEVIKDSLEHDYPGMSKKEVYQLFKEGKIKVMIPIPRLFSDYVHEIKDVDTKIGIINGDITLMSKSDMEDELEIIDRSDDHEIEENADLQIITDDMYDDMLTAHRKGIRTPLDVIFNNRSKVYNQLTVPSSNMFSSIVGKKDDDKKRRPLTFDFLQEDAPQKYFDMVHNIDRFDPNRIANRMNSAYGKALPLEVRNAIVNGAKVYVDQKYMPDKKDLFKEDTFIQQQDDSVIELEKAILDALDSFN